MTASGNERARVRLRVAQIVSGGGLNGVAVHVVDLTRRLSARGHHVTVVFRPGSWIERELAAVADVVCADLRRWPPDELRRIGRILTERQGDVVHSHMGRAHLFAVLLEWNLVRPSRMTVVHDCIDPSRFDSLPELRSQARAELGFAATTVVIGKIGNVLREKGVHDLVDAMPSVLGRAPHVHLLIQGRAAADDRRELTQKVRQHALESSVTWLPEVAPDGVKRTLAALDVAVIPSLVEPLSNACLEAMAAGLPVVGTRLGGMPELIVDAKTGFLVPPASPRELADAIVALACDPDRRAAFGRQGRNRAWHVFAPGGQLTRIEGVYTDLVSRRHRATSAASPSVCPAFDPRRATYRCVVLPCPKVIDLLPLSHAPDRVAHYREQMRNGVRFPPVSVIRFAGCHLIADGHKRFSAYRQLGHGNVVVEIWPLRRWLLDQWRQACGNARKNVRIVGLSYSDPGSAWRLLLTTLLHWRRVATSLVARAAGRLQ